MLKIRDGVDLKELEKYGAIYAIETKKYYFKINDPEYLEISEYLEIPADKESKFYKQVRLYIEDEYYSCWTSINSFDKLYDLIKADLIEKVDD